MALSQVLSKETIVDAISRAILIGFQKGFEQGYLSYDGSSNVSFSTSTSETALLNLIGLAACTNAHEAIVTLGQEINLIKNGLAGLGVTIPAQVPISTIPLVLE